MKHPQVWIKSIIENESNDIAWEQKIVFREKNNQRLSKKENGFDIFIYNIDEIKDNSDAKALKYNFSQNIQTENDGCLVEDSFSVTKNGEYIYEIIPVLPKYSIFEKNKDVLVNCNLEEIIASIDSFRAINIVRPKPKPVITAPYPLTYKVVNGKLVCAKENDKPRKSKKDKGHHLDMECCLDPDEDPNPWCTY